MSGQTQWSKNNFTNAFKRPSKRKPGPGSDTNSVTSTSTSGRRMSMDKTIDNAPGIEDRGRRRSSTDSSLRTVPTLIGNKLRKSARNGNNASADGRDPLSRSTTVEDDVGPFPNLFNEDAGNFTEDSDYEQKPQRPTLSPHQSHVGYLTLSSPLITAETVAPSAASQHSSSSLDDTLNLTKSNTLTAPAYSQRRSPSPTSRLREAFKPARKNSATNPKTEAETSDKTTSNGGSGGLGGLLAGKGRRQSGSTKSASRSDLPIFDDQPLVQEPGERNSSPKKAFPSGINTSAPATPPPNGPSTVVTPPTPTDSHHQRFPSTPTAAEKKKADATTKSIAEITTTRATGSGTTHRRINSASNQPSKLFNSMSAPLTPAPEEVKTPGGSLTSPQGQNQSGFFSSMFSAAQNAATSLSSTIQQGVPGQRSRSGTGELENQDKGGGEEVILPPGSENQAASAGKRRQLAVETLGSGNLSLSHLGISDEPSPMSPKADTVAPAGMRQDEILAQAEDDAAQRAISVAYSEQPNGEKTPSIAPSTEAPPQEPASTPVRATTELDGASIRRAGSVRSRLSNRRRRTRGSSATTGTAITPVIAGPAGSTAQRLTGFAVANPKRNRDFHNLFRSVPDDDYLIEDYSAALQREILLHGRLYVSEGHICFSSNILGWVTNLVMSFDEVISVEKRSTAVIFQNGMVIQTLQARNVFASLLNRDSTYELIISIWKITHPNLKSSLNGAPVEGIGTGDKTEKAGSAIADESESEEVYDEDDEDDDADEGDDSFNEINEGSNLGSEIGDASTVVNNRKVSAAIVSAPVVGGSTKLIDAIEAAPTGAAASQDFPGPAIHEATDCGDSASHFEKVLMDVVIPAPLGKIYSMMFGPASSTFMRKWLVEDQKSLDLQLEDDKKGLGDEKKTMNFSYIKPLSGSIGPKQTKCIITQTLEQFDLEKAVTVACSTQNPDVPNGNIFVVKTRYCLMWAPGNATRVISNCTIEWSGKSWLKGPIEKGANDGQLQYAKDLTAALKAAVTIKPLTKGARRTGKGGRRKKDSSDLANGSNGVSASSGAPARVAAPDWGLFEPVRSLLGPVATILSPSAIIGFLSFLIIFLWWRQGSTTRYNPRSGSLGIPGLATPQRIAAYEEMWRGEESELWKWIEDRVGLDGAVPDFLNNADGEDRKKERGKDWHARQKIIEMEKRIVGDEMGEREMLDAIRVTKERLLTLEEAVKRRKGGRDAPPPPYEEKSRGQKEEL
ncbi:hypothetical protein EJ08DRAFT_699843 [Tothia fuscella]|uniref:VASt domain-containing protein n=1 Tax=Tothia fuscella TaxID=1048955 RepID=A0A9P4NLK8_9PEZI|nr:hypothetical protein EJ08DRAFT_699843 [Tothia fuscella]